MRRVPWIALGGLALALGVWLAGLLAPFAGFLPGCAFKRFTGIACATCPRGMASVWRIVPVAGSHSQ